MNSELSNNINNNLDRRKFIGTLSKYCAGGVCAGCGLAQLTSLTNIAEAGVCQSQGQGKGKAQSQKLQFTREIDYYNQLPENKIQCFVCPLNCILKDGETCFCRTRTNVGGKLYSRAYDNPCILRIDAIEKLPLNHFRPGSQTMTIGVGGCNLRCLYCQNWEMSQTLPDQLKTFKMTARDVVTMAKKKKVDTIAFSYTEPVAFIEYAKDVAIAAKKAKLKVVVATAAFVETEPLLDLAKYVDAFTIAIKGFDEEFYKTVTGTALAPVLKAAETIKTRTKCWLELVNLIVPTYNDNPDKLNEMTKWIHDKIGDDVPIHFSRFVPMYKLKELPRTPVQTLDTACAAAQQAGSRYIYTSNIAPHEKNNTFCAKCGERVIERLGFKIIENKLKLGTCPNCKNKLPGVWI